MDEVNRVFTLRRDGGGMVTSKNHGTRLWGSGIILMNILCRHFQGVLPLWKVFQFLGDRGRSYTAIHTDPLFHIHTPMLGKRHIVLHLHS